MAGQSPGHFHFIYIRPAHGADAAAWLNTAVPCTAPALFDEPVPEIV
jgi:hypothetical protein